MVATDSSAPWSTLKAQVMSSAAHVVLTSSKSSDRWKLTQLQQLLSCQYSHNSSQQSTSNNTWTCKAKWASTVSSRWWATAMGNNLVDTLDQLLSLMELAWVNHEFRRLKAMQALGSRSQPLTSTTLTTFTWTWDGKTPSKCYKGSWVACQECSSSMDKMVNLKVAG